MLIYDGDCGFCTTCVRWLQPRLRIPITVIAWQEIHDLDRLDLTQSDVTTAAYFVDAFGRRYRGHQAVAHTLLQCRGALPMLGAMASVPPLSAPAAAAYRLVARHRHKLPGATAACATPRRASFTPSSPAPS